MRPAPARLALLCALSLGPHRAGAQAPPTPDTGTLIGPTAARIDGYLARAAARGFSGAVLLARDGDVILHRGYGTADRASGARVSPETPFLLGSIGKQFTATAILALVADGRLTVRDSVGRFFPGAPADKRGITVEQLLRHTSGLPYLPSAGLFGDGTRDSVMREMLGEPLVAPPGSRYAYSTPGYVLLAGIIERAAGMPYERFVATRLFAPAGLRATGFLGDSARWAPHDVRSYADGVDEGLLAAVPAFPRSVGAGSIVGTVGDLRQWYVALTAGRVVPADVAEAQFAPAVEIRPGARGGYAWSLVDIPTGTVRQIAGDIGGYNAELRAYPAERMLVAFASNARVGGRGYREAILNAVARLARGDSVPVPPPIDRGAEAALARLAGTWVLAGGGRLQLRATRDSMWLGAVDAAGVRALAPDDSASRAVAASLDAAARRVLRAARDAGGAGDDEALDALLDPSLPRDARGMLRASLRAAVGRGAAPPELLGTTVLPGLDPRTWVRVPGPPDSQVVMLAWSRGRLTSVTAALPAADPMRLRGEAPGVASAYDLFSGRLVRVRRTGATLRVEAGGRDRGAATPG